MEITQIQNKIYEIRGQKVMLDFDLAALYQIPTKVLKQSVKRNIERFPADFMYELTADEFLNLRSQIVTSSYGGHRYRPYAFTEQGIAMLSSVLRSKLAIEINIYIVRTFVFMRQFSLSHKDLSEKLRELEEKFNGVYEALRYLLDKEQVERDQQKRKKIGYVKDQD